ncbi:hypothetical protein ACFPRL_04160 [Pseudoclavibacter helvolus]
MLDHLRLGRRLAGNVTDSPDSVHPLSGPSGSTGSDVRVFRWLPDVFDGEFSGQATSRRPS